MKIGPFFYIHERLIYNACLLSEGRAQADKIDNSFGHEQLYDQHFAEGDYIDFPRGRVIWDVKYNRAIIYIDPCINREEVINQIIVAFDIEDYVIEYDEHYHCAKCLEYGWNI